MFEIPFLESLPPEIRETLVRILAVILAFLLIWLTRRVLTWIVVAPIRRLTSRTSTNLDDRIVDALIPAVRLVIIAIGSLFVAGLLLAEDTLFFNLIGTLARILIIMAVLVGLYRMVDIIAQSSNQLFRVTGITLEDRLIPFMRVAAKIILIAIGLVIMLQEFGYDVSGLIAGLGLGGLAFSFAAKDTVENLFGFTAIVSDSPFNVGEYIKTPDAEGIVEHVGVRSTRLRQLDQALVTVPNNKLAQSAILNWSRLAKRRVDFILGVTYSTNTQQMNELLQRIRDMLRERETVESDSVVVYFVNFGDNSLDILVRCYVRLPDWAEFTAEKERIQLDIMDIVSELQLSIAFPSRSLYIENLPSTLYDSIATPRVLPQRTRTSKKKSDDYKPDMPHGDQGSMEEGLDETPEQR